MSMWRKQRGEGKAGCIFWTLVLLVGAMLAVKIIPVKIADMHLKDQMEDLARHHADKSPQFYENRIYDRSQELFIPLEKKNVKVEKTTRWVRMQVEYEVQLDFVVTTYTWKFKHDLRREIFLM